MISIPCRPYARFQELNLTKAKEETKRRILVERLRTRKFMANALELRKKVTEKEGGIIFEWPTGVKGWDLPEVKQMQE